MGKRFALLALLVVVVVVVEVVLALVTQFHGHTTSLGPPGPTPRGASKLELRQRPQRAGNYILN